MAKYLNLLHFSGVLALVGCTDKASSGPLDQPGTTDSRQPESAARHGVVVLAGGGSEGESDDASAWSARLYPWLWSGGDVSGDGLVRVAVLATSEQTDWLPSYMETLGADEAFNLILTSTEEADAAELDDLFADVDAVFIKGGDQGEYYDLWNGRRIEALLRDLVEVRGGGIGGTSAGAMSQAEYALAGGADYISADVLADATTEYLDDVSDGGSAIHDDFLGFVPGVLIDTHFVERARLGRLAGAMARVIDEGGPAALLGIGLEARTGVVIDGDEARVIGAGSVTLLRATDESVLLRPDGAPLVWTDLAMDVLTEGWRFDLGSLVVDTDAPPDGASAVAWEGVAQPNAGEWYVDGDLLTHERRFGWVVSRDPRGYTTTEGTDTPVLEDGIGVLNAHSESGRAAAAESLIRALIDHVGVTGFLVGASASLGRDPAAPARVRFEDNPESDDPRLATLVVDSAAVRWTSLAPEVSAYDVGDGSLSPAGAVGLILHIADDSDESGLSYDAEAHQVVWE